jgi:hypothetical protein
VVDQDAEIVISTCLAGLQCVKVFKVLNRQLCRVSAVQERIKSTGTGVRLVLFSKTSVSTGGEKSRSHSEMTNLVMTSGQTLRRTEQAQ